MWIKASLPAAFTHPVKTFSALAAATSTSSSQRPLISSACPDCFGATDVSGSSFSSPWLSQANRCAVPIQVTLLITTQLSCLEKNKMLLWVTNLLIKFYLSVQYSAADNGGFPCFSLLWWITYSAKFHLTRHYRHIILQGCSGEGDRDIVAQTAVFTLKCCF